MTDLLDHAYQLAAELRDGEFHLAALQIDKKEGRATQADVNAVVADLEFLRRTLRITLDRAEAIIRGVELPPAEVDAMLQGVRDRLAENGYNE